MHDLNNAITMGTQYLQQQLLASGQFTYRVNMNPDVKVTPRYDIQHHAGSLYTLCMAYKNSAESNVDSIELACNFLLSTYEEIEVPPEFPSKPMAALWSSPEMEGNDKMRSATLGGSGLGLLALVCAEKIKPGITPEAMLIRLAEFLCYMQNANGCFVSKFTPGSGGKRDRWTSLYYPGEAAFGLLSLHSLINDERSEAYLSASIRAMEFLAKERKNQKQVPLDHWALLVTKALWPYLTTQQQFLLRAHAIQICRSMLSPQHQEEGSPSMGAFTSDGRTSPTATRVEGLLAAACILDDKNEALRSEILSAAEKAILFLQRSQIKEGAFKGGIPRAIADLTEAETVKPEKFNRRRTEIRIDYVQHAISSMLQFQALRQG